MCIRHDFVFAKNLDKRPSKPYFFQRAERASFFALHFLFVANYPLNVLSNLLMCVIARACVGL
ncbi:hypothetical protein MPC4_100016 [Methylocella tundrae]|uniref:Uncharacterized protein n=1 Tax=Methylocella tundrae TaxID=227605 RepID=A0A8B6M2K0_METTU|nr:hypothetical protein MPC4_100016 [Methylocella tundrae]